MKAVYRDLSRHCFLDCAGILRIKAWTTIDGLPDCRLSGRIPSAPVAPRERLQKGALDMLIILEFELSPATIEKLKPGRFIYGAAQPDNPLNWNRQGGEAGHRIDDRASVRCVIRGERAGLAQAAIDPRALFKVDIQMPSQVVGVFDAQLCYRIDARRCGPDMHQLDCFEVEVPHAATFVAPIPRRPQE